MTDMAMQEVETRRPVAYPIIIGTAFFVLLFSASGASPFSAVRMILAAFLVSALITVLCTFLVGHRHRGALLAVLLIVGLYVGPEPRMLAVLALAIAVLALEWATSRRRPMRTPWPLMSRVGNALAVIVVLAIGIRAFEDGTLATIVYDVRVEGPSVLRPSESARVAVAVAGDPDIYVILLDGYARADKQLDLFGHDNTPFLSALEDRGFEVAGASRSNYLLTAVSLASALNMRHLETETELAGLPVNDLRHVRQARHLINENGTFDVFRTRGYETVALSSGFEEVALRQADRFVDTGQLNEVELLTFRHTGVGPLVSLFAPDLFAEQQRERIRSTFRMGAAIAAEAHDTPRFTFVHVPSPHAPVVFDADGGPVAARDLPTFYEDSAAGRGLTREEYGRGYIGQVEYLNGNTLELIERILASSAVPPVILVLSDHGSGSGVDFADLASSDLDERTASLFAALTPGTSNVFEDDGTLVNVFGRLFEAYFDRPYEDQPNTVYGWQGPSIFDIVPVDPARLDDGP